jgi:UDP-N-acetylmuramoyl-tripeptide--D-alanyl-D-alanine ligase
MNALTLEEVARMAGGTLEGPADVRIEGVGIDSRAAARGELFVAIRGARFDGHAFLGDALAGGAVAAMVERGTPAASAASLGEFPRVVVDDTLIGLQRLAAAYRRRLPLRAVGVTGSSGKTSTKEMIAAVLGAAMPVAQTLGNLNNHLGVPLSLLRAGSEHAAGVFEIGMNHPGEIAPLAAMVRPEVAVVTNIGTAHIEFMGSRSAIAREKGALLAALPPDGTAIIPAEDEFLEVLAGMATGARVFLTGIEKGDLRAEDVRQRPDGCAFQIRLDDERAAAELPVPGLHMVCNALMAVAVGLHFGLGLGACARALSRTAIAHGRLSRRALRGAVVLDDTYNANPESVLAALQTLAHVPTRGRRIAVLGQMAELGGESEAGHRRVGEAAARSGLAALIAVGGDARWIAQAAEDGRARELREIHHVPDTARAAELLGEFMRPGDLVLVKGSRSMRMESILAALEETD